MAADPACTLVLIGMGLRDLSMSAFFVPVIKRLVRSAAETPLSQGLAHERTLFMDLAVSDDGPRLMGEFVTGKRTIRD